MALRWGLAGAGKIAHDFTAAIQANPKDEQVIGAVAARDLEKAKLFAESHDIPTAYGSYEDLAHDNNIDIVYINVINPYHHKLCLMMLRAGKHVLCEKPLSLSVKETREIIEEATRQKKLLVEACWSRFTPVYEQIRAELRDGNIGDVQMVCAQFCKPISDVERLRDPKLGGSIILDIGVYTIQFAMLAFNGERPESIHCAGNLFETGVDSASNITLLYSNNRMARLVSSAYIDAPGTAEIYGTKGQLTVPSNFWAPTELLTPGGHLKFKLPDVKYKVNYPNSENLYYEAKAVVDAVRQGNLEVAQWTHADTLLLSEIAEECLKQLGVKHYAL